LDSLKRIDPLRIDTQLFPSRTSPLKPSKAALDLADQTGLVAPVVVRLVGNRSFPRYELLSGEESLAIVNRLLWPTVPAVILESVSVSDAKAFVRAHLLAQPVESAIEKKLTPSELMALLAAVEETKKTRDAAEEARVRALQAEKESTRPRRSYNRSGDPTKTPKLRFPKAKYKTLAEERGVRPELISHLRRISARLCPRAMEDFLACRISFGHARALASFAPSEQERIATRVITRGASVRDVEASARKRRKHLEDKLSEGVLRRDPDIVRYERAIAERWGWRTSISFDEASKTGSITFHFDTLDGFHHLIEMLGMDSRMDSDVDV
jgi:ParB-like chromosome segregation protein Spo0J